MPRSSMSTRCCKAAAPACDVPGSLGAGCSHLGSHATGTAHGLTWYAWQANNRCKHIAAC